jgi:hypothetical protein
MKLIFKNYEQDLLWRSLNQMWDDLDLLKCIDNFEIDLEDETIESRTTYNN